MKKTLFTILLFIGSFSLIACKDKVSGELEIVSKDLTGNTYSYVLNVIGTFTEDELIEIAYTASSDIYKELIEDISNSRYVLNLTLQVDSIDKVDLVFNINFNLENPGLTFVSEHLK